MRSPLQYVGRIVKGFSLYVFPASHFEMQRALLKTVAESGLDAVFQMG